MKDRLTVSPGKKMLKTPWIDVRTFRGTIIIERYWGAPYITEIVRIKPKQLSELIDKLQEIAYLEVKP